jgi:hypothetical protein
MHSVKLMKENFWRLFRGASVVLVAMGMLLAATSARAACGDPPGLRAGFVPKLSILVQPGGGIAQSNAVASSTLAPGTVAADNNSSIVGLWHVLYTSGGQPLYESFDQWHSDGTELENPNLPPATGPLCVGVWKQTGPRTFRLHHVGWNFDPNGNFLGPFTLDETNVVDPHGQIYQGTFDLKFYDVNGNLVQEVAGTQRATRITVN